MNLDEYINEMSWKKIILMIMGAFVAISLLRVIMFMTVFKETQHGIEKTIQHKQDFLDNIHQQFQEADKRTDKLVDETFKSVHQTINRTHQNIHDIQKNMEKNQS